ncbi:MAG: VacJ family lipoprotein [Syntrophotaleaceae bacterium]
MNGTGMDQDRFNISPAAGLLMLLGLLLLSGCATPSPPLAPAMRPVNQYVKPDVTYAIDVYDPLEGFNRGMYRFNFYFDKYLFLPVTTTYETISPDFVEAGVSNFFANIRQFYTLANCLLQLKPECVGDTTGRILVNSTLGIGGLWDPATALGIRRHKEDFGQTLGHYGVGNGAYLVLPVFGPSNLRDTAGLAVHAAAFATADPFKFGQNQRLGMAYSATNAVDARHRVEFRYYETGSPFEYELVRLLYTKYRQLEIEK